MEAKSVDEITAEWTLPARYEFGAGVQKKDLSSAHSISSKI
jgi:hypothetical protein